MNYKETRTSHAESIYITACANAETELSPKQLQKAALQGDENAAALVAMALNDKDIEKKYFKEDFDEYHAAWILDQYIERNRYT